MKRKGIKVIKLASTYILKIMILSNISGKANLAIVVAHGFYIKVGKE